ncbi:MAG: hypothetical protein AABX93_01575 [Nanoarchaeota archaeon]
MYNYHPTSMDYIPPHKGWDGQYDKPGPGPLVPPEPKEGKKPTLLDKLLKVKIFG